MLETSALAIVVVVIGLVVALTPSQAKPSGPRTHSLTTSKTTGSTSRTTNATVIGAVPHSSIKVIVANGTTTAHGSSEVRVWLTIHGFDTAPFPAYDTVAPESADAIYVVGAGTRAMAIEVAEAITLGSSVVEPVGAAPPVPTTLGADVVVVMGNDLATRADAGTLG